MTNLSKYEMKTNLPEFFNYKEEKTDDGYEAIMDFLLSWTIRCSHEKFKDTDSAVYNCARLNVFNLIFGHNRDEGYYIDTTPGEDFTVNEVSSTRQEGYIDLLAKISVSFNGRQQKYILNIENKFYSTLKEHQLKQYRAYVNDEYRDYTIINLFISLDTERGNYKTEKQWCLEQGYKFLTIGDMRSNMGLDEMKTGNALFDTLWSEL